MFSLKKYLFGFQTLLKEVLLLWLVLYVVEDIVFHHASFMVARAHGFDLPQGTDHVHNGDDYGPFLRAGGPSAMFSIPEKEFDEWVHSLRRPVEYYNGPHDSIMVLSEGIVRNFEMGREMIGDTIAQRHWYLSAPPRPDYQATSMSVFPVSADRLGILVHTYIDNID